MSGGSGAAAPAGISVDEEGPLRTRVVDGVLRCVLNRPAALNALTPAMLFELSDAVDAAGDDAAVHAVVVEGAGDRAFSSGFDIKVLAALGDQAHRGEPLERATGSLVSCLKPTVALVRGHCVGAGFDLAMSCDFRLATPGSRFSVPAVRIGTVYRPQSIERIWRVLGPTVAKALFVAGRVFDAEGALRVGIVQEVVEDFRCAEVVAGWTNVPEQGSFASAAHKQIIHAFGTTADRSQEFWEPLNELRRRSVASRERHQALHDFADRSRRADEQ